jgi:hypothetical protein
MNRRTVLALVAVATSTLLLSACAVGQAAVTQSSEQVPSVQGVGASVGYVTVDDALVLFPPRLRYPAGSDAPLSLALTNGAITDDRLIAADSPAARAVEITPATPGTTPPPGGCVFSPNRPVPSAGSPTPTGGGIAQRIPSGGTAILTANCPHLLLVGLTRQLTLLDTVPVRLTFANAGTVALVLPVQTSGHPLPQGVVPGVDTPTGGPPTPGSPG